MHLKLRHTYLRVLHPLLTKTQLRDVPYKRPQIVYALESLVANSRVRDVNPITKRLVERCLGGDWCVNLIKPYQGSDILRHGTPMSDITPQSPIGPDRVPAAVQLDRSNSKKLKSSKSVEHLRAKRGPPRPPRSAVEVSRRGSNGSATSLPGVATAKSPAPNFIMPAPKRKTTARSIQVESQSEARNPPSSQLESEFHNHHHQLIAPTKPLYTLMDPGNHPPPSPRRSAPPPPPKRRKPPAVPVERTLGGTAIAAIKSSVARPLLKNARAPVTTSS